MDVKIQDPNTVKLLSETVGMEIPIYGPEGQLLGRFTPAPRPGMSFPESGITDEEFHRRVNDTQAKWIPADEVLARLRSLEEQS